jgi:hypothetical protein
MASICCKRNWTGSARRSLDAGRHSRREASRQSDSTHWGYGKSIRRFAGKIGIAHPIAPFAHDTNRRAIAALVLSDWLTHFQ